MQNLIVCIIASVIFGSILSVFFNLSKNKRGEDFTFEEFRKNFKLKNIDFKYMIIYFIILYVLDYNNGIKDVIIFIPLCFSLILAFILDMSFMIIPDTSSIVIIAAGIVQNLVYFSRENLISSLSGMIVGGLTFWIINFLCEKITKKSGFGLGDIKLLGALGFFFGLKAIIVIIFLSVAISAVFSIIFLVIKSIKKFKEEYIPFAPFIVISSFIVYMISADRIIDIYFYLLDKIITKI